MKMKDFLKNILDIDDEFTGEDWLFYGVIAPISFILIIMVFG